MVCRLAELAEVGVLGLRSPRPAAGGRADGRAGLLLRLLRDSGRGGCRSLRHRRGRRRRRRRRRGRGRRQHLALRWSAVLRGDVDRALVVGRALLCKAFEFALQLALPLPGCLEFGALGRQSGFPLLRLALRGRLATFLFLLLELALSDLLLELAQTGFLRLFLSLELFFLAFGLFPT